MAVPAPHGNPEKDDTARKFVCVCVCVEKRHCAQVVHQHCGTSSSARGRGCVRTLRPMRAGGEGQEVWRVEEVLQVEVGREEAHESAGACEMSLALAHCDKTVAGAVMTKP
jgi:hypothetical protein